MFGCEEDGRGSLSHNGTTGVNELLRVENNQENVFKKIVVQLLNDFFYSILITNTFSDEDK